MFIDTKTISNRIARAIGDWCNKEFPSEFRDHLGASIIGRECEREIWYSFRWVGLPDYNKIDPETGELVDHGPRMRRLFQRGHAEEDRFISYLRGIGAEVFELDPSTGNQWRINDCAGHFGGSLDGIALLPTELTGYSEPMPVLTEFKTYGTKAYAKLKREGLDKAKPEHVTQMSVYGYKFRLDYALYLGVRKDDDDLHVEFRKLNPAHGEEAINKGRRIIRLPQAPEKISNDPTTFKCKFCDYKKICHENAPPASINCRSCKHAYPELDAMWGCSFHEHILDKNRIKTGCNYWTAVTR